MSYPPECMDFDHRPGEQKVAGVSVLSNKGDRHDGDNRFHRDRMLAEVAKCDLVCANCHRTRTKTRNNSSYMPRTARRLKGPDGLAYQIGFPL